VGRNGFRFTDFAKDTSKMQSRAVMVQIERPHDYFFDPIYTISGFHEAGGGSGGGDQVVRNRVLRLGAVNGANRYKFFKTPTVPMLHTVPPDVLLSIDHVPTTQQTQPQTAGAELATKTVATQSDYRESETQTDPYTPYYLQPDSSSEQVCPEPIPTCSCLLPAGAHTP